jgi:hypothetical protein
MTDAELLDNIQTLFQPYPEVSAFLRLHNEYVHMVDDTVDKDKPTCPLANAELALAYYTHPVYVKHADSLRLLSYLHHNTYRDSVAWEQGIIDWKLKAAATLRHQSLDMFYAMVLIYLGPKALQEISLPMREYTFLKHLND